MQSLNISTLMDDKLQVFNNKILEMKHALIFNINSILTKCPHSLLVLDESENILTLGTPVAEISIIALSTGLYCECF